MFISLFFKRCQVLSATLAILLVLSLALARVVAQSQPDGTSRFSFLAAGDMRQFVKSKSADEGYFDGLCEAASRVGAGAFMVSPGDFDPPAGVRGVLDEHFGKNYPWYIVVGNHEVETPEDMAWVSAWAGRGIPGLVRKGPPGAELTTYSFDHGNSHFVAVNDYFNDREIAKDKGGMANATLDWLEKDLAATSKTHIWIIGHQPIESLPDMDTGRKRHETDSVSANPKIVDRFITLLRKHHVRAYICGHTHSTSVVKVRGIWQADSGHGRGAGDKGAPSTFLKFNVDGEDASVEIYRADAAGKTYTLRKTVPLK